MLKLLLCQISIFLQFFTTADIFDPNGNVKECTPVQWLLEI